MKVDYTKDEEAVATAIVDARKVQDFIWGERAVQDEVYDKEFWASLFQKRVDKISEIDFTHPNAMVELRKRLLQQAALSIRALVILQNGAILAQNREIV